MSGLFYYTLFLKMNRKELIKYSMNNIERIKHSDEIKKSLQIAINSFFHFFVELQNRIPQGDLKFENWLSVYKQVMSISIEPYFTETLRYAVEEVLKSHTISQKDIIQQYHEQVCMEIAHMFQYTNKKILETQPFSFSDLMKLDAFSEQLILHNGTEDLASILIQAEHIFQFKRVMFFSYNPWLESFEGVLGAEMEKVERMRGKIDTEPVFALKKPLYLKEPAPFVQKIAIDLFQLSSIIFIPIQKNDQLLGWLSFDQMGQLFDCPPTLLKLLEEVGNRIGLYLNRKQQRTKFNYKLELTEKEIMVLNLLVEGYSNKEIAKFLFLSEFTVRDYIKSLMVKLNTKNRTHLLSTAFRMGIVD